MDDGSRRVIYHDLLLLRQSMLAEVLGDLGRTQKQIQPKYFYDAHGCTLFEAICGLPEYYPTRSELAIMRTHARDMAETMGGDCAVIEIGCGNSEKTRLLLDALAPCQFIAVDIAHEQLEASCKSLAFMYPAMSVIALRADFAQPVAVPADCWRQASRRVLYFPGSTIGNFTPLAAQEFLRRWTATLGSGGAALIGVDLKKDASLLNAAYDDAQGVTAAFNSNLLVRLNRELGADFDVHAFRHHAFYHAQRGCIEMHLRSTKRQRVTISGHAFEFQPDETIHTESSYKYSVPEFQDLCRDAGYAPVKCWVDEANLFSVHLVALP